MYELLDNLFNLTKTHLEYKVKHAEKFNHDEEIEEIIEKTANRIYDMALDIIGDAEYDIDKIIEQATEEWEDEKYKLKNYNVFQQRNRGDLE